MIHYWKHLQSGECAIFQPHLQTWLTLTCVGVTYAFLSRQPLSGSFVVSGSWKEYILHLLKRLLGKTAHNNFTPEVKILQLLVQHCQRVKCAHPGMETWIIFKGASSSRNKHSSSPACLWPGGLWGARGWAPSPRHGGALCSGQGNFWQSELSRQWHISFHFQKFRSK